MSRLVASLVYSRRTGSMLRKSVLAYMAERASDDGSLIWASKQRMADEVECSKQSVIKAVKEFLAEGILSEDGKRKTQGGYTVVYSINLAAVEALPQRENRSTEITPNQSTGFTRPNLDRSTEITSTSQPVLPKPSSNRPSSEAKASSDNSAKVSKPESVSIEVWSDFMTHRKAKVKTPFTQTALNGISREAERAGWPLEDALAEIVSRGWQGFKAEWVTENDGNNRNSGNNGSQPDRPSDALLRASIELNKRFANHEPERASVFAITDTRTGNDR